MTDAVTWSFSRMKSFETCPKQYYHTQVLGEFPKQDTVATIYGSEFHKACENYIGQGTELPLQFSFAKSALDALGSKPGATYCELKLGLTETLEPCGFFDDAVWFRGIVDLLIINGNTAWVVDYKTGKSAKYADPGQLELMALCVFKHYPEVQRVHGGLLFVVAGAFVKRRYTAEEESDLWASWLSRYARLRKAHATGVWNPNPSGLCRAHCPVVSCPHNGAG